MFEQAKLFVFQLIPNLRISNFYIRSILFWAHEPERFLEFLQNEKFRSFDKSFEIFGYNVDCSMDLNYSYYISIIWKK